jgi:ABC-type multidrug transport system fused ATPase/permease subunit
MLATVVTGRVAAGPTSGLVTVLAVLLVGSAVLDTVARTLFSGVVGRAEGRLRADLLGAAFAQPLPTLESQGVGELLDRVDDDTRQVATLLRRAGWTAGRASLRSVLAWGVAGATWWPAWLLFPLVALATWAVARGPASEVSRRKLAEEVAWSDHSAQLEEAVAGRDDVRSSLGQPHVVRRYAEGSAEVLRRVRRTCASSTSLVLRTGLVLHTALAALAVSGVALVGGGALGVAELVTLWLLVTAFVGQLGQVSHQLPEVQAGLGALSRIRSLLTAPREPRGGAPVPSGPVAVEVRDLDFGYGGGFALRSLSLVVPAGTTCALVGRSGAGKSTLVKLLSRAVEPPPGSVLVGGQDVTATDVEDLRRAVGVVTQRTELLAATLEENITLFDDVPPGAVERAVEALGLTSWVAALPSGLQTQLGIGGTTLSAGEEQLVAFARLLVRDVAVVVLDEATARMDPQTERRVTRAAERLLSGRTGIVVAHRLSTTRWCDAVAVLDAGRLVQHGPREQLAVADGPFRELLLAAGDEPTGPVTALSADLLSRGSGARPSRASRPCGRRSRARLADAGSPPAVGVRGGVLSGSRPVLGTYGTVTGLLWGRSYRPRARRSRGRPRRCCARPPGRPVAVAYAFRTYPLWWVRGDAALRLAVLRGQTEPAAPGAAPRRARSPPAPSTPTASSSTPTAGSTSALGSAVVFATAVAGRSLLGRRGGGRVLLLSPLVCSAAAPLGRRPPRRRRATCALLRALARVRPDAVRTVKLAAATSAVRRHLEDVDRRRVRASVRENSVLTLLEGSRDPRADRGRDRLAGLPARRLGAGHGAARHHDGQRLRVVRHVAGAAITEVPVASAGWRLRPPSRHLTSVVHVPDGVDLVSGAAPAPETAPRRAAAAADAAGLAAVHDDGTVGVRDVDLTVDAGDLVLLVGQVGSGKSSLLAALAGLVDHEGRIEWNDREVDDPQSFLRPGQVAYVGQVPRVLSGSFADNVTLDHDRAVAAALDDARLATDVEEAGGHAALVGHRGVRLSGGQVQRLALARALATGAELLVADDVSSALDARTEVELWEALRRRGTTVLGSTSKRSALARADCVVVLEEGRVVAVGRWSDLSATWGTSPAERWADARRPVGRPPGGGARRRSTAGRTACRVDGGWSCRCARAVQPGGVVSRRGARVAPAGCRPHPCAS